MLLNGPDVVAGRQLPGIAIAAVAAVLLVVTGRFGRATVVAIGVLDVVTLAWTSSPVALRPLLAVALLRLMRRSDDRSVIWFGSFVQVRTGPVQHVDAGGRRLHVNADYDGLTALLGERTDRRPCP
ncbi:hypothetical protein Xph01_06650 [Micromonospora phaseoli]|nr:hypothetical protein Xph01_06650 [Micromonospora phaseoli]